MKKIVAFILAALMTMIIGCGGGGGTTAPPNNTAPVANAGISQTISKGTPVILDGSGSSDANGDTLTYIWAFTSKPAGSIATLSNASIAKPTFTPDVVGAYVLSCVANDGKTNSSAATVTITVTAATATSATLKIFSQGALPTGKAVAGIGFTIELPTGVTVKTTSGGVVDATEVVPSGLLAGKATMTLVNYSVATATSKAKLDFTIASTSIDGVGVGEYVTLTFIVDGLSPAVSDFNISSFKPVDLNFAELTTLAAVKTLTVQ